MQASFKTLRALAFAILILPIFAHAQSFQSASDQAATDLEAALTQLTEVRDAIASEKIPLLHEVSQLEDSVRQKSTELDRLRRLRDNSDLGLNDLRKQVSALRAQNVYAGSLLDDFVTSFETRIDYSETQLYAQTAQDARLALDDADISTPERFEKQIDVIATALDRLEKLVGGYTFEGRALTPEGEIENGNFAAFGPSVYFASTQSELTGITYNKLNAAEAAITSPGEAFTNIRQLIETREGHLPIDPTLGKALKMQAANDSIAEHLAKGGSVGAIIITLGLICLVIGIIKLIEVLSFKTPRPEDMQQVLTQIEIGDRKKAKATAAALPGAGATLLSAGVEHVDETRGTLEEILYEKILAARPKLERLLPFIALTAAASPLLGLLGTVTGMIKTFNLITLFGTGDAKSLSDGISEALVTTELGLIVAIPALILHGLLSRMARQKIGQMEQTAVGFINGVVASKSSATKPRT